MLAEQALPPCLVVQRAIFKFLSTYASKVAELVFIQEKPRFME